MKFCFPVGRNCDKGYTILFYFLLYFECFCGISIFFVQDFRSDSFRGHHVSTQRMRIQRRAIQCRHDIEALNSSFITIFKSLVPAEEEKAKQKELLLSLQNLVTKEWPNAKLHLYGSCANSFGVSKSDIDVCLAIDDHDLSKSDILLKLADILQSGNLQNVQVTCIKSHIIFKCTEWYYSVI